MSRTNPPTGASGPGSVGLGAVRGTLKRSVQATFEGVSETILFFPYLCVILLRSPLLSVYRLARLAYLIYPVRYPYIEQTSTFASISLSKILPFLPSSLDSFVLGSVSFCLSLLRFVDPFAVSVRAVCFPNWEKINLRCRLRTTTYLTRLNLTHSDSVLSTASTSFPPSRVERLVLFCHRHLFLYIF
jgi:hypothetical protein